VTHRRPPAPETWAFARRLAEKTLRPLDRFLHVEASSGVVLIIAAAAALVWANSGAASTYEDLWHTPIKIGIGSFVVERSLHFVVNDVLMTVFFFVAGLEIRRELYEGELSDRKRATLPAAAALGGMVVPALIFLALSTPETRRGFGVPAATDIAFAVGVLALLGKRVPSALRVLLLSLAIIDDIGAIIVIAVFYTQGVVYSGLLIAGAGVAFVLALQRFGVRNAWLYVLPGAVVWLGMLRAGIHPTIAGVALGLLTPARAWFGTDGFLAEADSAIQEFRERADDPEHRAEQLVPPLTRLKEARSEALSPAVRIQVALHPWVAFGIMPLFALANAGVSLKGLSLAEGPARAIATGVLIGLTAGKPIGILVISFLCVKLGLCALPRGVRWRDVLLVGLVAGIGFTMAIFIAGLAFEDASHLAAAKLGVLSASLIAGVIGLAAGRVMLPRTPPTGAAQSLEQAETSTEL
jgi:Na+:H+ antiporter, NhaA family